MSELRANSILPIIGQNLKHERGGRILLDVDHLEVGRPGVTAIIGHNGAGKSLLLKALTGLVKPDEGAVTWNGQTPERSGYNALGYMKQNAVMLRRSVLANLAFPLVQNGDSKASALKQAMECLKQHGLEHLADLSARVLSGGEKQRLSLARTLITDPELILLDEPVAGLDPVSAASIDEIILFLKRKGKCVVLVTHNLGQARRLADDIIFLDKARILEQSPVDNFFKKPKSREAIAFIREITGENQI